MSKHKLEKYLIVATILYTFYKVLKSKNAPTLCNKEEFVR